MSVNNDYREARKKEIMDILLSNPNQSLLLLKLLPEKYLIDTLKDIFERHILGRFGPTASDELVYKTMDMAYEIWAYDNNDEKHYEKRMEKVKKADDEYFACIERNLNELKKKAKEVNNESQERA